jgi:hypothetical protein
MFQEKRYREDAKVLKSTIKSIDFRIDDGFVSLFEELSQMILRVMILKK